MTNEIALLPFIKELKEKIDDEDFVIDKTGKKCVEILASKIILDPRQPVLNFKIKKTNEEYVQKELKWYLSQNLSIINYVDDIKIWNMVCSKDNKKEVNSNYGWIIYSEENFYQYQKCLFELIKNRDSRRAMMIYNRPSMQIEYNRNDMQDFICTTSVNCFIRNTKLIYIITQRSCDFIYGFYNDLAWHCFVYNELYYDLKVKYINLDIGDIIYIPISLHTYENHFSLLQEIYKNI